MRAIRRWRCGITNPGKAGRELTVNLEVSPGNTPTTESVTVAAGATATVKLPFQMLEGGAYEMALRVVDRATGKVIAAAGTTKTIAAPAEFAIHKSFYRDHVAVRYVLHVAPEDLGKYAVQAELRSSGGSTRLATRRVKKLTGSSGELRLGTRFVPVGKYEIQATLVRADGTVAVKDALQFVQARDPKVASRLVTVRDDNVLIVEGKAFFPIGIYESPGSERAMKAFAEAGFNLCCAGQPGPEAGKLLLDKARAHGLHMWIPLSSDLDLSTDADKRREALKAYAEALGNHPALLMWESIDEPAWGSQSADGLYEGYSFMRTLDQQRPIWTNHAPRNTIATLTHFNRATDASGCDIYPVPAPSGHSDLPNKTISVTGDETAKNVTAVNGEKPIFMVLQGFGWAELGAAKDYDKAVLPTLAQSRFMAYDAIAHGATGVLYWGTAYTRKPSRFFSELKSVISELAAMQDVLASRAAPAAERAQVVGPASGVSILHKRTEAGRDFIILVNDTPGDVAATVKAPGMAAGQLRRLFEGQAVQVAAGGVMQVALSGYDVAVLSNDGDFRDVRKDFSAEWKNARSAAEATALLTQPGNLVRNGGFEVDTDEDLLPDTWGPSAPFCMTMTEAEVHSGKYSLAITSDAQDASALAVQHGLNTKADQDYRLSGWIKCASPDAEYRIYVEWTMGGRWLGGVGPWTKGNGEWQQMVVPFKTTPDPQGGAYVVVQVKGKGTAWFDDLRIEEAQ